MQAAQEDANKALEQIKAKMEIVNQNKQKAKEIEKELKAKEGDIFVEKEKAEKELEQVKPMLEEAKTSVASIPNDAMSEVKSFNSPPQGVKHVMEAVVTFMGMRDTEWRSIRAFLGQSGVTRMIASMDVQTVAPAILKKVEEIVKQYPAAFDQAQI